MKKLGKSGLRWLKGFNFVAVGCWIGGGMALVLLYLLKAGIDSAGVLFGINQSIHHVDTVTVLIFTP